MISSDDKKAGEVRVLERFREVYPDFPKGALSVGESPDFILARGPRNKIGIELTRLHQHTSGDDPFSYDNIAACLLLKEDKLSLYRRKRLKEYWLIISVRDPAFKPRYNLGNKLISWKFRSEYDRIFLFNVPGASIYELNIASPS
jgi:hypothetical protein